MTGTNLKRIRVVERGGVKLKDLLCVGDPWVGQRCERQEYLPCRGRENDSRGIHCQKENITYIFTCLEWTKGGRKAVYWGETARNGFKRGKVHKDGLVKELEKIRLWRHAKVFHGGQKQIAWYKMKVKKVHRTPLVRHVAEGVEIVSCKADLEMNSKGQWNGSKLPRMVIEREGRVELDDDDVNVPMMN